MVIFDIFRHRLSICKCSLQLIQALLDIKKSLNAWTTFGSWCVRERGITGGNSQSTASCFCTSGCWVAAARMPAESTQAAFNCQSYLSTLSLPLIIPTYHDDNMMFIFFKERERERGRGKKKRADWKNTALPLVVNSTQRNNTMKPLRGIML